MMTIMVHISHWSIIHAIIVLSILCLYSIVEGNDNDRLNLKSPDTTAFKTEDCQVDSVSTRLFMPNECHTIKSVVVDGVELWKGTFCPLVLLHHLDNNPKFARIITEEPAGVSDILYSVTQNQWIKVASNAKMTSLTQTAQTTTGLILDINCTLWGDVLEVKAKWNGLDAQLFAPYNHHFASEVCLSGEQIWKQKKKEDKCIFVIAYLEYNSPIAVHLLVRDKNDAVTSLYFVRDGTFKSATGREYHDKLAVARNEACKSKSWSACV